LEEAKKITISQDQSLPAAKKVLNVYFWDCFCLSVVRKHQVADGKQQKKIKTNSVIIYSFLVICSASCKSTVSQRKIH